MKSINIFLGSSIVELKEERDAFSDIISELNSKLKDTGYFIYLDKCEYENGFVCDKPTQQNIDKKIEHSTYAYFIVKSSLGKMTEHEFNVALNSFLKYGRPKINVMFKQYITNIMLSDEALCFQNKLKELQYYYKEYQNKEELKLNIVLNIAVDDIILSKKLNCGDRGIYLGETKLIDTELIPTYSKHGKLNKLQKELEDFKLQETSCTDKRERRFIREKIHKITTEIREIENLIYQTMLGLTKASRGKITPLLSRAINFIENGDIEKAAEILNIDDVFDELDEYIGKTEKSIEAIQAAIETAYIAIETMIQLPESLERTKTIELLFEKIISIECTYKLNRLHCGLYVKYLIEKEKYDMAEKYALMHLEDPDTRINSVQDFISSEYALLGMQLHIEKMYHKNPVKYQKLYTYAAYHYILMYSKVVEQFDNDTNINPYMLGIHCDNLLDFLRKWIGEKEHYIQNIERDLKIKLDELRKIGYRKIYKSDLNGKEDAERLIAQIELKTECERLNNEPQTTDPKEYLKQYSNMLKDLLDYFQTSNNMFLKNNSNINFFIRDYKNIVKALENECEEDILLFYSQIKIGYAEYYLNSANFSGSEKAYCEAYKKLKMLLHEEYTKTIMCSLCANFSIVLLHLKKVSEAEEMLLEGIDICEDLVETRNELDKLLARMYTNYVILCRNGRIYDCINKGIKYSKKAFKIFKFRIKSLNEDEKISFVQLCNNYGLLLLENGKSDKAFKFLSESIDIIILLNERSIQENYVLVKDTISLAVYLSIKENKREQIKKKLEFLHTTETIDSFFSKFE